jgi:5-methyltetrahydrofolate--homocysteine methyltransferase
MLENIVKNKKINAHAVFGIFTAKSTGEDIEIFDENNDLLETFNCLRQQNIKKGDSSNLSLADLVAPANSKTNDHIGLFAITTGHGVEEMVKEFEKQHDDYSSITVKVLADRLAEAFAELLHEKVRKEYWGYASSEKLSSEELISEKYEGIRPAMGYPSLPDHSENHKLFKVLDVEKNIGARLTDTYMMDPAASVSGMYFANSESKYFAVGLIKEDQVKDYAKRKGISEKEAEKWLSSNLSY